MYSKIKNLFLKEKVKEDIVKIDAGFPFDVPYGFTNAEINQLFEVMPNFVSYTPHIMSREGYPGPIGVTREEFERRKAGYLDFYSKTIGPKNKDKIKYLDPNIKLEANLAFTTFLSQAYILGPYFKKMKIPYVFTLYPGGGFGLNSGSDGILRKIFDNKFFRKVIVNNDVTRDHLLENKLCPESKIEFLFGVPVQFKKNEMNISKKKFYKKDKGTFDICFTAFRYDEIGRSKGYDIFIETAKKIVAPSKVNNADIRFHVIGNYDENVIDVSEIKDKITFYGVKTHEWLQNFYYNMDIAIAPVRPFLLYTGSFDGYPMCFEQGVCGVAMFQSDELNVNRDYLYYKQDEVVNIKLDPEDIVSKVEFYFNNLEKLYELAEKGRKKTQILCGLEDRIEKIKQILLSARG